MNKWNEWKKRKDRKVKKKKKKKKHSNLLIWGQTSQELLDNQWGLLTYK